MMEDKMRNDLERATVESVRSRTGKERLMDVRSICVCVCYSRKYIVYVWCLVCGKKWAKGNYV